MKRVFLIVLALLLVIPMSACSLFAEGPQILLNKEEISSLSLTIGQDIYLFASNEESAIWSSSDSSVVEVSDKGRLLAHSEGTATITLTVGEKTDSICVTVNPPKTAWTIGDSIFDWYDNSEHDAIQCLLIESGYSNHCLNNIGNATISGLNNDGIGIVDHIESGVYDGFYDMYGEPDLILIFRGTNDVNHGQVRPDLARKKPVEQAIKDVCAYFSTNYPNARIVWATPLWRETIDLPVLDEFRQLLHDLCPQYGVEVFDLHLVEPFASLDGANYKTLLPDGVHPSHRGSFYMKDAFVAYLTGK